MITGSGVGYVPQGRRVWPSLSVDEHLRLSPPAARATRRGRSSASTRPFRGSPSGAATAARSFPAASSRCWRSAARCSAIRSLLVMDEPTEGLAPVIVEQVEAMLVAARATRARWRPADRAEHRRRDRGRRPRRDHGQWPHQPRHGGARARRRPRAAAAAARRRPRTQTTSAAGDAGRRPRAPRRDGAKSIASSAAMGAQPPARVAPTCRSVDRADPLSAGALERAGRPACGRSMRRSVAAAHDDAGRVFAIPFAERIGRTALVAGTFDTKGRELQFIARPAARRSAFRRAPSISRPRASRRAPT